jgi:putative transposase
VLTGRRFRLDFSDEQEQFAEQIAGACRAVWNTGLQQRRDYRRRNAWINYREQAAQLADAKVEHPWLGEVPGHCLQQTLMDLDRACRTHGTFKVRWRSSRRWRPSFRFPEGSKMVVQRLNRSHARVRLPKLGFVRFRLSRSLDGAVIRSATVTREGRHWHVSFLVDDGEVTPAQHAHPAAAVGIDRGVAVAIATSDGQLQNQTFMTAGERKRVLRLQRRLARGALRGSNRAKARAGLAEIRNRERRRRKDFCVQSAHRLVTDYSLIVIEDLKTQQMTRSAKGTVAEPGANVKQKAGLNCAMLAKGWHQFALALSSAARYSGTHIVAVPPRHTSQRCSACGHVDPKSRESQAVFRCTECRQVEHADINAAKNILAAGLAVTACGDLQPIGGSMKQEPAGTREELLRQPHAAA